MKPAALMCLLLAFAPAARADDAHVTPHQRRDADSVGRVEHDWTVAEVGGDVDYVRALLDPAYRSISSDGSVHNRDAILEHARTFKQRHPDFVLPDKIGASDEVRFFDNTAVVTRVQTFQNDGKSVTEFGMDTFVFYGGRWHAIYSQHTSVKPK